MSQTMNVASPTSQATRPPSTMQSADSTWTTLRPKGLPLYKIYELPAPIRTFPLPSFYPNNPVSLFHVLFAWAKQTLFPPPAEPSIVHEGIWSSKSQSVNIINEKSMRALWEQGFYGKGNLSRSEPNWLKREQVRRGLVPGLVSELVTASRREERRQMKWERAKSEQEAIRQLRLREAQLAADDAGKPSIPATEAGGASSKLPSNNNPAQEASTDAEIFHEATLPLSESDLAADGLQIDMPEVPQDTQAFALIGEPEPLGSSAEDDVSTNKTNSFRYVDRTSSHSASSTISAALASRVQNPNTHIEIAKIAKPSNFLTSSKEAETTVESETTRKPDDVLSTTIPLTRSLAGPIELLSLPNSYVSATMVEGVSEVVDAVFGREVARQSGAVIPATISAAAIDDHLDRVCAGQSELVDIKTEVAKPSLNNGHSASSVAVVVSPVGPLELLSLPNAQTPFVGGMSADNAKVLDISASTAASSCILAQKLSTIDEDAGSGYSERRDCAGNGALIKDLTHGVNGDNADHSTWMNGAATPATASAETPSTPNPIKRRKSVRFSPKIVSATYELSDPPSPGLALYNGAKEKARPLPVNGNPLGPAVLQMEHEDTTTLDGRKSVEISTEVEGGPMEIENKEHLQLTSEEAFFLAFGLGALRVVDAATKAPISIGELFNLFRSYSYFPSRPAEELQPDDSFMVNYAVYHHFRSLGWVPRAGIKFGVGWLLYARGPVFDHAEFGVIIIPSYSDQWWKDSDRELPQKTWHWLHGVVRVLSHVQKSLVLVYVDVPSPPRFDDAMKKGPAEVLKLYKIREVMVKRWSSNRNR